MANILNAFRGFVLQDTAVVALIGSHFYWDKVQDGVTPPYVRAKTITDIPQYHQQGEGPLKAIVQIDMWDDDEPGVDALLEALRKRVSGYAGNMNGYHVRLFVTNRTDTWTEDQRLFHRMLEVEIGYV